MRMRPCSSSAICETVSSSRYRSWETTSTAPSKSRTSSSTTRRRSTSRCASGSSSSRTSGPRTRHAASATSLRWPPLSAAIGRSRSRSERPSSRRWRIASPSRRSAPSASRGSSGRACLSSTRGIRSRSPASAGSESCASQRARSASSAARSGRASRIVRRTLRSSPTTSCERCATPAPRRRVTAPASGSSLPASSRRSVDLPDPLAPIRPIRARAGSSRSRPSRIRRPPKDFTMPRALSAAGAGALTAIPATVTPGRYRRSAMRGVDVVAPCLHRVGVETFFGVVGSGNFTFTTSLHALGARYVAARHENGAVCMADAHARVSGQLGCVSVHQGPGLTNAMTGLTEAAKARTPLVLVAADTPAGAVTSNFYVDQDKLAEAVGAVPVGVNRASSAYADTERAIRISIAERRAVLLTLPLDVANQEAEWPQDGIAAALPAAPAPSPHALEEVVAAIEQAQRPVIVAGRGAVLAGAREPLEALGDAIGAPLATSAMGHGIFNGHPFALGISGGFASPLAQEVIGASDLILAFGARLTRWTTANGALVAPDATVVQVDVDESGFADRADCAVIADARLTAGMLKVWLDRAGHTANGRLDDDLRE